MVKWQIETSFNKQALLQKQKTESSFDKSRVKDYNSINESFRGAWNIILVLEIQQKWKLNAQNKYKFRNVIVKANRVGRQECFKTDVEITRRL